MGRRKIIDFNYPDPTTKINRCCSYLLIEGDSGDYRLLDLDYYILLPHSFKSIDEIEEFLHNTADELDGNWFYQ